MTTEARNRKIRFFVQPSFYLTIPPHLDEHPLTGLPTLESLVGNQYNVIQKWEVGLKSPIYRIGGPFNPEGDPRPPEIWIHPLDFVWVYYIDVATRSCMMELLQEVQEQMIERSVMQALKMNNARVGLLVEKHYRELPAKLEFEAWARHSQSMSEEAREDLWRRTVQRTIHEAPRLNFEWPRVG